MILAGPSLRQVVDTRRNSGAEVFFVSKIPQDFGESAPYMASRSEK
jgi:hypothetical protein